MQREREQGLGSRGAWPGRAEGAAGPTRVLWFSPALEAIDLASHEHRP